MYGRMCGRGNHKSNKETNNEQTRRVGNKREKTRTHTEIENERTKRAAAKSAKQTQTHTERENEKKKEE